MAVALSGSIVLAGSITGSLLGTSSYSSNAGLLNGLDSSVFALTSSLGSFTSSLNGFTSSINTYTASNNANIAALNAATASLYNATASLYSATASLYGATSSLFTYSASATSRINALDQYTASLNTRSASFACVTATNNFACAQYFSNASNAISFSSTGSLYSDGGMRLTKDLYVSGTSYFNNVTVFGTQSINYITSSQLNIASNLITVNTSTPAVRFGGLAVYDSGSLGTGLTGSILWDSENNHWVYSNPSGSSYSGGMFISGPRSAALGSEQGTTACALMMGQGGDHITSSAVFHYGNSTCFYGQSFISSSGNACFSGQVCSNTVSTTDGTNVSTLANNYLRYNGGDFYVDACAVGGNFRIRTSNTTALDSTALFICGKNSNVGIGTTTPSYKLDVAGDLRTTQTAIIGNGAAQTELQINSLGGNNQGPFIRFQKAGAAKGYIGAYSAIINGTSDDLTYYAICSQQWMTNNSTSIKMLLDGGGNLMVGSADAGNAGTINVSVGVAGTTAGGLQLWAATNQTHYIQFGDGTAGAGPYAGYVGYAHSTDSLLLGANAATRAIITSAGVACFSSTVCAPTFVLANGNCITALRSTGGAAIGVFGFAAGSDTLNIKGGNSGGALSIRFEDTANPMGGFYNSNFGIGTLAAAYRIDAFCCSSATNTVTPVLRLAHVTSGTAASGLGAGISFFSQRPSSAVNLERAAIYGISGTNPDDDGDLAFYTRTDTGAIGVSEKMRINSDGNVGIGTTSPFGKLSVDVTAAAPSPSGNMANGLTVHNTSFGRAIQLGVNESGAYNYIQSSYVNNADVGVNLAFFTGANERMRITSGGNVGIGTTDPQKPLELRTGGTSTTPSQIFAGGISQAIIGGEAQLAFSSNISPTTGLTTASELTRAGIGFQYISAASPSEFSIGIQCTNVCNSNVRFFNGVERMRITSAGVVGIGTTSTSTEANLFLGAQGSTEGGQLVLQKATSCSCATHLDNYTDSFRVLVGNNTSSTGVHMLIDHKNGNACFYGNLYSPTISIATSFTLGSIGHYQKYSNTTGCFAVFCASQGAILYVTSMHNGGRATYQLLYSNGATGGASISVIGQTSAYGPACTAFALCGNGWVYAYQPYGGPTDYYAISMNSNFAWGF